MHIMILLSYRIAIELVKAKSSNESFLVVDPANLDTTIRMRIGRDIYPHGRGFLLYGC